MDVSRRPKLNLVRYMVSHAAGAELFCNLQGEGDKTHVMHKQPGPNQIDSPILGNQQGSI